MNPAGMSEAPHPEGGGQGPSSISEEVIGLSYHYLTPDRQSQIDTVIRVLQLDRRFDFLLAIFAVTINDRPLPAETKPTRPLLRKIMQALEGDLGPTMLYSSPYNEVGDPAHRRGPRYDYWDLDVADYLHEFRDLQSLRAFLQHGTGRSFVPTVRDPREAAILHDLFLNSIVGESRHYTIWGCADVRGNRTDGPIETGANLSPAEHVSGWFRGVFWDDLLVILNAGESTLTLLAVTSD